MPGAFNAGIACRLPSRTTSPSMLRPPTAPAKHYILRGRLSLSALLAAPAKTPVVARAA